MVHNLTPKPGSDLSATASAYSEKNKCCFFIKKTNNTKTVNGLRKISNSKIKNNYIYQLYLAMELVTKEDAVDRYENLR